MNLDLTNKNAFVGGASKGIGKAIAIELALLGANVTVVARSEAALQKVSQSLDTSKGQHHDYLVLDYSDSNAVKTAIEAYTKNKTVHVLINNTGGPKGGEIHKADINEFLNAYNNHLVCNHILAQATIAGMKNANFGRIINVISISVKEPVQGLGVSNTTRGAVASWAKTLSVELAPHNITVNNILPGFTYTERLQEIIANRAQKAGITIEASANMMKAATPVKRFGTPEEVGAAAAFLASPAAAFINGINLTVDGGMMKSM